MNKLKKKISLALAFTIVSSNVLFFNNDLSAEAITTNSVQASAKGYVPYKVKITKDKGNNNVLNQSSVLPEKFDLRAQGKVTSVKNQGGIGDCWAFSFLGGIESNLAVNTKKQYDFSEINMATHHGFDLGVNDGGNNEMATAYVARWDGMVNESDDPYPNPPDASNVVLKDNLKMRKHVQDIDFIPNRTSSTDNSDLKTAVMNYGAVSTSLYMDESIYLKNNSYYCNDGTISNHAIDIVGWDDSYSADNFNVKPAGNGAFICKNSWGQAFGEQGYFYVSYYDKIIGNDNAVITNTEAANNYSKIYQYDTLGLTGYRNYSSGTNWFSNVFTASNDVNGSEELQAVSFYTINPNASYEIYAEPNYEVNGFNNIKATVLKSGVISVPGYHTIKLNSPIQIPKGKKFAVAIKLVGSPIPVESTVTNYASKATAQSGQSYIGYDGQSWTDLVSSNVCLKAFTKVNYAVPVTGIALGNTTLNINKDASSSLIATVSPATATDKNLLWESDNEKIVTVDDSGNVKAISPGKATVTVATEDGNFKAQCYVYVKGDLKIESVNPLDSNKNDVPVDSDIRIVFPSNIKTAQYFNNISLLDSSDLSISMSKTIQGNILILKPTANLSNGAGYRLSIPRGAIADEADNISASSYETAFCTRLLYNPAIHFTDLNFEGYIREQLNKPTGNITSDDMKTLTDLYSYGSNISSLDGLEYAINLSSISMTEKNISSLKPLSNLVLLNVVSFSESKISDITPIHNLYNLKSLNLYGNNITSIIGIENLKSLTSILLSNNKITDINPLANYVANSTTITDKSLIDIDVSNNYIDTTTGSNASIGIQIITNTGCNFNYAFQNQGAIITDIKPQYLSADFQIYGSAVITFKNNISKGAGFDKISIVDCKNNYSEIPVDVTLQGNKLIVKPKNLLAYQNDYQVYLPADSIVDTEGKTIYNGLYQNFRTSAIQGDGDSNGAIDIKDIAAMGKCINTTRFDATGWNSVYDINSDGRIDLYDLVGLSRTMK